jgi:carbon-monoxide dehydrogenase medium subunit
LDAAVSIVGPTGRRSLPLLEFITGPGRTALSPEEIVVSVSLPEPGGPTELVYFKQGTRRAMDLAAVSVAVRLTVHGSGKGVRTARIVLGAVGPTPIRLADGEALAVQEGINPKVVQEVARLAATQARPISDVRASAAYRSGIVEVLTRRALTEAWERLRQGKK